MWSREGTGMKYRTEGENEMASMVSLSVFLKSGLGSRGGAVD